jgi:glycosyltransferase involved in cell wall biosynthesis
MRILCNCTTLVVGGALQASTSFIYQACDDDAIDWFFAVSKELYNQLDINRLMGKSVHVFNASPAKNYNARVQLLSLEKSLKPDAVFTFFGPAYVNFRSTHYLGFAVPWVTHPNSYAKNSIRSLFRRIIFDIDIFYKTNWLKRADYWIVEAEVARQGIVKLAKVSPDRIAIVKNSCRNEFRSISSSIITGSKDEEVQLLYISAYYIHKNFEIIPYVARKLIDKNPGLKFHFVLTISPDTRPAREILGVASDLGVLQCIRMIGSVPVVDAIELYKKSHVAFIPTLLETFSATYPEAMAAGLPIVASDFDFARNVCDDAALYFRPDDASDAADKILRVLEDEKLRIEMVARGRSVVSRLPSAESKYEQYKAFILDKLRR